MGSDFGAILRELLPAKHMGNPYIFKKDLNPPPLKINFLYSLKIFIDSNDGSKIMQQKMTWERSLPGDRTRQDLARAGEIWIHQLDDDE